MTRRPALRLNAPLRESGTVPTRLMPNRECCIEARAALSVEATQSAASDEIQRYDLGLESRRSHGAASRDEQRCRTGWWLVRRPSSLLTRPIEDKGRGQDREPLTSRPLAMNHPVGPPTVSAVTVPAYGLDVTLATAYMPSAA
jgi:hypothetical protein